MRSINILCGVALSLVFFDFPLLAKTKKHTFDSAVLAEVYKHASGDDLWIYRFEPEGHDPSADQRPAAVFFFGAGSSALPYSAGAGSSLLWWWANDWKWCA